MNCADVHQLMHSYLTGTLARASHAQTRRHLDTCSDCWNRWNLYRWEQANNDPLLAELRTYLGDAFDYGYDSSTALADEWDAANPTTPEQARAFFGDTTGYLYNLTIWEASGNRPRYVDTAIPALPAPITILDYGCGIGIDTIALRARGHTVVPAELPSPHADFARWRMVRRRQPDTIHEPDDLPDISPDLLWIIDTLDHLADPHAVLGHLLPHVPAVITEDMAQSRRHGRQRFHHHRPYSDIAAFFDSYDLHPHQLGKSPILTCWTRTAPRRSAR